MILGGAWSNVWDRITRKYVVDYFSFHTKCRKLERVVFNLADMFIFLGGFLVIFLEYAPEKLTEDVKNGILLNAAK